MPGSLPPDLLSRRAGHFSWMGTVSGGPTTWGCHQAGLHAWAGPQGLITPTHRVQGQALQHDTSQACLRAQAQDEATVFARIHSPKGHRGAVAGLSPHCPQ